MILDAPFEMLAWGVDDPRIGPFFDELLAMERLANIAVQTAEGDLGYVADSIFFLFEKIVRLALCKMMSASASKPYC